MIVRETERDPIGDVKGLRGFFSVN